MKEIQFFFCGKTMFTMHILDEWLNGQLPANIRHVFYFALRHLTHFSKCSMTDLMFEHHDDDQSAVFDRLMSANPDDSVLIFDGADECPLPPPGFSELHQQEAVRMELVSCIIQGKQLKRVCVLVTSRPGGIPGYKFDKTAEIYGLTQDKIFEYVSKFCRGDKDLQECTENYIKTHANIASLCYVPQQCSLVCRIVRAKKKHHSEEEFPKTLTQLYILSVKNLAIENHPNYKDNTSVENVIGELKEPLLSHAKLAKSGMRKSPVQVTFSQKEIEDLQLKKPATECGLLTVSKEKKRSAVLRTHSCSYSFNHLTMQEFLGASALVSSPQEAESMVKESTDGQLDLVFMFLFGLIGDHSCKEFLDALDCQIQMTAERLLQLVIEREQKSGRNPKESLLLVLLMIFESINPGLWSTVADCMMEDGKKLDLSGQHISPVELQAMLFVFPQSGFTKLDLSDCHLSGAAAGELATALQHLPQLTELNVSSNDFNDEASGQALVENILGMTSLLWLDLSRCSLSGAAAGELATALQHLPQLTKLNVSDFNDEASGQALIENILGMTSLLWLLLADCHIGSAALETLAAGLHGLTGLEVIRLDVNTVTAAVARGLADSLSSGLGRLRILGLGCCHMDDDSAVHIAAAFADSRRQGYLYLFLGRNHLSEDGERRVREIMGRRTGLGVDLGLQQSPSVAEGLGLGCDRCGCESFHRRPTSDPSHRDDYSSSQGDSDN